MRKVFLAFCLTLASAGTADTVDRIAAVIDQEVLTVSEVGQMVETRFFARQPDQSDDEYRRAILEALIAQTLRLRDVERFRAPDIDADSIEVRLQQIRDRFVSPEEFDAALTRAELTIEDVRTLIKRQLQVETYIQDRFSPLVFVPVEEIEQYYRTTWSEARRARGLPVRPLSEVREEIRDLLRATRLRQDVERWTNRLRLQANVDVYAWR
jgi:hypothetical protein